MQVYGVLVYYNHTELKQEACMLHCVYDRIMSYKLIVDREISTTRITAEILQRHSKNGSNTLTIQTRLVTCRPALEN